MRLLALLALLLLVAATPAHARYFHGGASNPAISCPQGSAFADGCVGAVPASTQFTGVLSGYASRPPWNVAGMDYPVGVPTATALVSPTTISTSGVTVNATNHTVTVTGNNVTLNGINFGLNNGWEVIVQGTNDTIQNSLFTAGTNQNASTGTDGLVLQTTTAASNFSLLNCEVDGGSIAVTSQVGQNISFTNSGSLILEYNYFHNSGGDMIDISASDSVQVDTIRYNLWKDIGVNTAHQDTIQWYNTTIGSGSDLGFDTVYQTTAQPGGGNGMLVPLSEGPSSTMSGLDVHNPTIITTSGCNNCNWALGFYDDSSGRSDHVSVRNGWVDPTGINMFTGSPWLALGKTTAPAGSALAIPMIMHDMHNMTAAGGTDISIPSFSSQTGQGYYVYPDINGLAPSQSDIFSIGASPGSGNVSTGNPVTFTLSMAVAGGWTVTGSPTLSLNSGGTAFYTSGSGTNALTFTYIVGSGDSASNLAVTAINLAGGSITDSYGNAAVLTGPLTTFTGLTINSGPTLTLTSVPTAAITNSTIGFSFSYTTQAPGGLSGVWNPGALSCTVGSFTAGAGTGSATCTTPSSAGTYTLRVSGTQFNLATATAPNTTVISGGGGGGVPVVNATAGSFTGSVSGYAMSVPGSVTGTLAYGQLLFVSGVPAARVISGSGISWNVSPKLTQSSQGLTTLTPIYASSTNAGVAQTSQTVGTLTATNSPTGWTIGSCSAPGSVNCASWFSLSSGGILTVTGTGAANLAPSDAGEIIRFSVTASNGSGSSAAQEVDVVFFDDGALSASAGSPQLPTFFSGYAIRPPWQVPGVDYAVGVPAGTSLTPVTTATLPSGCARGSSTVTCSTAGAVLNAIDFSTGNGWGLVISAANITVENCNFLMGSNAQVPIKVGSTGAIIVHNTIDENGVLDSSTFGGVIYVGVGSATGLVVEYNYVKNAAADFFDTTGGTFTDQYNLVVNDGLVGGTHPDFNQGNPTSSNTTTFTRFNTWVESCACVPGQGTTYGDNSNPVVGNPVFNNNVAVSTGGSRNLSYWLRTYLPAYQAGAAGVSDYNYFDITAALGPFYGGSSGAQSTFSTNANLIDGSMFSDTP